MVKKSIWKRFKKFLKVNKEGAIIGAIIGVLPLIVLDILKIPLNPTGNILSLNNIIRFWIPFPIEIFGVITRGISHYLIIPLYIIIGAFIDSLWRPDK